MKKGDRVKIKDNVMAWEVGIGDSYLQSLKGITCEILEEYSGGGSYRISLDNGMFLWKKEWLELVLSDTKEDELDEWVKAARDYLRNKG